MIHLCVWHGIGTREIHSYPAHDSFWCRVLGVEFLFLWFESSRLPHIWAKERTHNPLDDHFNDNDRKPEMIYRNFEYYNQWTLIKFKRGNEPTQDHQMRTCRYWANINTFHPWWNTRGWTNRFQITPVTQRPAGCWVIFRTVLMITVYTASSSTLRSKRLPHVHSAWISVDGELPDVLSTSSIEFDE